MMSNFVWTVVNGNNRNIHLELPLAPHIEDEMKGILDDANYGEIEEITVKYSNGAVSTYKCYPREN